MALARRLAGGILSVAMLAPALAAQGSARLDATRAFAPAADSIDPRPVCFRGKPLPRCRTLLLYEVAFSWHLVGSTLVERFGAPGDSGRGIERDVFGSHLDFSLGLLRNVSTRDGLGALLNVGFGDDGYQRYVLAGRYRRWIGRSSSIDVSAGGGVLRANEPYESPFGIFMQSRARAALTGDVGVRVSDWAIGTVRADWVPGHQPRPASAVYAGLRVGSWPAVGATGGLAVWLALLIAAFTSENFD